jgi:hypothetical protein
MGLAAGNELFEKAQAKTFGTTIHQVTKAAGGHQFDLPGEHLAPGLGNLEVDHPAILLSV